VDVDAVTSVFEAAFGDLALSMHIPADVGSDSRLTDIAAARLYRHVQQVRAIVRDVVERLCACRLAALCCAQERDRQSMTKSLSLRPRPTAR
jgi:hypothetical protein